MKFCSSCGNKLKPGALFCPNCGAKQSEVSGENVNTPPIIAPQPVSVAAESKKNIQPLKVVIPVLLALIIGGVFLTLRDKGLTGVWEAYELDGEILEENYLDIVFSTKDEVVFRAYEGDKSMSINFSGELRPSEKNKYRVRPAYVGTTFYYQEWIETSMSEEDFYSFDDLQDIIEDEFTESEIIDVDQKNKTITVFEDYYSYDTDYDELEFTLHKVDKRTLKVRELSSGARFMLAPLKK